MTSDFFRIFAEIAQKDSATFPSGSRGVFFYAMRKDYSANPNLPLLLAR